MAPPKIQTWTRTLYTCFDWFLNVFFGILIVFLYPHCWFLLACLTITWVLAEYEKSLKTTVNTVVFEGFSWFGLSLFILEIMRFGIQKNIGRTVHLGINFCIKFGAKMTPKSVKKLIKSDPKTISENYSQNMSFWRPFGIPFGTLLGVLWETFWEPFWHSCSLLGGLGGF